MYVAATSLNSGLFSSSEQLLDRDALPQLLHCYLSAGSGYLEVRLAGAIFPALAIGIKGDHSVVQCLNSPESMALLAGDGSVPPSTLVDVLIMDELTPFTGDYAMMPKRAFDIILRFVDGVTVRTLGDWHEL